MAKKEVSLKNEADKLTLLEVFIKLGMDPTLLHEQMITPKWIDIGFQGEDPTTDFRGTGFLGLLNLHFFVTQHNRKALECLAHSRDKSTEYFLACSGINVTHQMMKMFNTPDFCMRFVAVENEDEVLEIFGNLYTNCVANLDSYWVKSPDSSSFMNFNNVLVT